MAGERKGDRGDYGMIIETLNDMRKESPLGFYGAVAFIAIIIGFILALIIIEIFGATKTESFTIKAKYYEAPKTSVGITNNSDGNASPTVLVSAPSYHIEVDGHLFKIKERDWSRIDEGDSVMITYNKLTKTVKNIE